MRAWFDRQSDDVQKTVLAAMRQFRDDVRRMGADAALKRLNEQFSDDAPLSTIGAMPTPKPVVEPVAVDNPEQVAHADQSAIDAAFRVIVAGIDF
jgi:deoxyribodipyrimidine photolyase-like uncharacterized protein